jgi:predicted Rossmann fold flavoprotein
LGHIITPLAASLNAFFTREQWTAEISGLSFERAKITARREKEFSWTGPFLFTHKGISGPAVFAVSGLVAFEKYDHTQPLEVSIDLFPDLSDEELLRHLTERIAETPKKNLPNGLTGLVPKSLSDILCRESSLSLEKHAGEFSKKELLQVVHWLKNIKLHVIARGAGDEFVTAGGVNLKEVNPSTMESKVCPCLFFAGEILDVDGFTGGFNLQASWATGRLAGQHVVQ